MNKYNIDNTINFCTFISACRNSDGLSQFNWSHDGYWHEAGASFMGKKDTVSECAEACIQDDKCVAFNHHWNGARRKDCVHYQNIDKIIDDNKIVSEFSVSVSRAYIRCQGI